MKQNIYFLRNHTFRLVSRRTYFSHEDMMIFLRTGFVLMDSYWENMFWTRISFFKNATIWVHMAPFDKLTPDFMRSLRDLNISEPKSCFFYHKKYSYIFRSVWENIQTNQNISISKASAVLKTQRD